MKSLFTAIVFIFLSLAAGFFLSSLTIEEISDKEESLSQRSSYHRKSYVLKDYRGRLALFKEGSSKPEIIYNVFTDNLPDMDKFKLKEGIYVETKDELTALIEDYTS